MSSGTIERVCLAQNTKPEIERTRRNIKAGRWTMTRRNDQLGVILTGREYPLRLEQIASGSPYWRLWGSVEWTEALGVPLSEGGDRD